MSSTQGSSDERQARIKSAIDRITGWMDAHDASLLAENLAPGATAEELARAEAAFGTPLPADLRALWSLHDGQREEENGFVESLDLQSCRQAVARGRDVLLFVEFLREHPRTWEEAGVTTEETHSSHWLAFASRDSDSLVVNGETGRVFSCGKDSPPLKLLASSFLEWLERYAAEVEADDFAVEEGFGDCFLERRDREAERRALELEQRQEEQLRFRRATPLLEQFRSALEEKAASRCTEILSDALERKDTQSSSDALAMMFASSPEPRFVASVLRTLLNAVTLTQEQWLEVAVGGALLANNAIRDKGITRSVGISADRIDELDRRASTAPEPQRPIWLDVAKRVRAKAQG